MKQTVSFCEHLFCGKPGNSTCSFGPQSSVMRDHLSFQRASETWPSRVWICTFGYSLCFARFQRGLKSFEGTLKSDRTLKQIWHVGLLWLAATGTIQEIHAFLRRRNRYDHVTDVLHYAVGCTTI